MVEIGILLILVGLAMGFGHKSLTICKIGGVPTKLTGYWILFFCFILTASLIVQNDSWWMFLTAYVFVLIHEYGHALTAKKYNCEVGSIFLHPLGGAAMIENLGDNPRQEFWITINGPLTNFILAFVFFPFIYWNKYCLWFCEINVIILAFNIIPVYPMDGGRLLRVGLSSFVKNESLRTTLVTCFSVLLALLISPLVWYYWGGMAAIIVVVLAFLGFIAETFSFLEDNLQQKQLEIERKILQKELELAQRKIEEKSCLFDV
jgi:Zn-dependent protease